MKNSIVRNTLTLCFAFIIIVIGKWVIVAQAPVTGDWKADARPEKLDCVLVTSLGMGGTNVSILIQAG